MFIANIKVTISHLGVFFLALLGVTTVHGDNLKDLIGENFYFKTEEGEDRFVLKKECVQYKNEFTYLEVSVYAERGSINFDAILSEDDVDTDLLLQLLLSSGIEGVTSENLLWLRTAPLYRTPDTNYSGIWVRFNFSSLNAQSLASSFEVLDFGRFRSVGEPMLIIK